LSELNKEEREFLTSFSRDFGTTLSTSQLDLFSIYLNELWEWNKKINLTGLSSRLRVLEELFLDSIIPAPLLPDKGYLLDVGSGAGFPAIPLKICKPRLAAHLLEPNFKKVSFLKQVIRITKLDDIEVIRGRIDKDKIFLRTQGYDIITSRALADLTRTLNWCAPHLKNGGIILSFQGSQADKELERGSEVIEAHGLILHKTSSYRLPGKDFDRHLLVFKKCKA
jgi:16S rRNA (guanine527-N7)-methyltransferase